MAGGGEGSGPWTLERFTERLDSWVAVCSPRPELRRVVQAWITTRARDPYQGMNRSDTDPDLWFGRVPGTEDVLGNAVVCSYWIDPSTRTVVCNDFTTLSEPI